MLGSFGTEPINYTSSVGNVNGGRPLCFVLFRRAWCWLSFVCEGESNELIWDVIQRKTLLRCTCCRKLPPLIYGHFPSLTACYNLLWKCVRFIKSAPSLKLFFYNRKFSFPDGVAVHPLLFYCGAARCSRKFQSLSRSPDHFSILIFPQRQILCKD